VSTDVPFLLIGQDPTAQSQIFRFDVGLVVDRLKPGKIDGSVRILTDDSDFPEITLPVRGEVH